MTQLLRLDFITDAGVAPVQNLFNHNINLVRQRDRACGGCNTLTSAAEAPDGSTLGPWLPAPASRVLNLASIELCSHRIIKEESDMYDGKLCGLESAVVQPDCDDDGRTPRRSGQLFRIIAL